MLTRLKRTIKAYWGPAHRAQHQDFGQLRCLGELTEHSTRERLDLPIATARDLVDYFRSRQHLIPLFQPTTRAGLAEFLEQRFPDSYKEIIRRADLASRHVVEVLGSGETYLGHPINWWTDFKGGTWTSGEYQDLNATLFANDFHNPLYIGDIKLPWELNKHAHFLELAKAYWLTGNETYAESLLSQMEDWIERNPFLYGLGWMQNLIVAQRVINWCLALQAVWNSPSMTPSRLAKILASLYQHARYIPVHFEFAERASNHLFGNAAGLAVIAMTFPEFREAREWHRSALDVIESELSRQVYRDGVQYEQSLNYHRYVVEFCLLPCLMSTGASSPYHESTTHTIRRMLHFLKHMTQPNGCVQPISDADGARVWRFNDRSINDHRGLINVGAVLFDDPELKIGTTDNTEDVLWWLGKASIDSWESMTASQRICSVAFPDGGYFVLRENWRADAFWLFFDCGYIGMGDWPDDLSIGLHGHSDLLTFGLAAEGESLLSDIGSYAYTGSKSWHDYFRSARGHNVIVVDGQDQSVLTTMWAMRERARPRDVKWWFSADADFVTGAHDGYRRLGAPVCHRRSILLPRGERRIIIKDDLEGQGCHSYEALFHAMPAVAFVGISPDVWQMQGQRARVRMRFVLNGLSSDDYGPLTYRIAKGELDPIDGWYAPDYGVKEIAPVLHVAFEGTGPIRLYTIFELSIDPTRWSSFEQAEEQWRALTSDV